MKKLLTLLLLLHSFVNSSKASNEIIITYPNTQDVIFNVNSIYPIIWSSDNSSIPINSEVEILLSINDGKDYFIKLGTSLNDGIELIRVPASFSKSSKCRIKIQSIDNQLFNDESDISFSINANNWEFLIDNADSVRIPQGDDLAILELYAYYMRPFKKWHYQMTSSNSINLIFFHQQITAPLGCSAEQVFQYSVTPFVFVVSKNGTYRFTHTKENETSNFNTINVLNNANINSCEGLLISSYYKYFSNGNPVIRRVTGVSMPLVRGNLYAVKVFNDNIFTDFSGFLEIFESTVRTAQYFEVQTPQPIITSTFVVLDNSLKIKQISPNNNFNNLPVGKYQILALGYKLNYDPSVLLNQKITDIDFNTQNLLITENIKVLEVTPKCPTNLALTNTFHGILKEAVENNITSNQQIINSSNTTYQAGKSIVLEPGFFINRLNLFKAEIKTCQ